VIWLDLLLLSVHELVCACCYACVLLLLLLLLLILVNILKLGAAALRYCMSVVVHAAAASASPVLCLPLLCLVCSCW
jgi:hypothetical protein